MTKGLHINMSLVKITVKEVAKHIDNDSLDSILEHKCLDKIFYMKAYYKSIGVNKHDFYYQMNVCLTSLHPLYYLIGHVTYKLMAGLSASIEKSNYTFGLINYYLFDVWKNDFGINDEIIHKSIKEEIFNTETKTRIDNMLSGLVFGVTLNQTISLNLASAIDHLIPLVLTFMVNKMGVDKQDANTYYSILKCTHREIFNI